MKRHSETFIIDPRSLLFDLAQQRSIPDVLQLIVSRLRSPNRMNPTQLLAHPTLWKEVRLAKPLLSDELWRRIEPLLPPPKPRRCRYPGRKPLTHRQALTGILFVLKSGISWEMLP